MSDWLFTWKGLVPGSFLLLGAVIAGIAFREGTFGNVASIVRLAVSLLGFTMTIWTVMDARRQITDSGDRAENAITQAWEETRRAVKGIAAQLLATDCNLLRSGVEDLRQAAQDAKWERAVYRCQECRTVAYRLAQDHHLSGEEQSKLRKVADELQLIRRFIEKYRLAGQVGYLKESYVRSMDDVIGLLAEIQARLHHESLQPGEEHSERL